jgi:hypothetical protein
MIDTIIRNKSYFQSLFKIIAISIAMISIFGCQPSKWMTQNQNPAIINSDKDTTAVMESKIDSIFPIQYADLKTINQYSYQWISYRAKTNYTFKNQNGECNLYFVNRIDSIIYLNINLSGIEIVRMVLTPDEVIYVNKLNKTFYKGDYKFFQKTSGIQVTFDMIQAIMNGKDFKNFDSNFTIVEEPNQIILQTNTRKENNSNLFLIQKIILNQEMLMTQNLMTVKSILRKLTVDYSNYQNIQEEMIFQSMNMESVEFKINFELKNIKINTPGPTYINIPERFSPIDLK